MKNFQVVIIMLCMSLVSIIVPVYNVENYLARCLDSIINQSYQNIEILCVNDGSTDSCAYILQQYQKLDSRIKIFNKKNGGLSSARNFGMKNANGEYLLFVDSDDYVSSLIVEKTLYNAKTNNSDVVIFDYICNNIALGTLQPLTIPQYGYSFVNNPFSINSMDENSYKYIPITTWSKLYRTSFIRDNKIDFENGLHYEDVPFWAKVYSAADKLTYLPEKLYFYNFQRSQSIMQQNDEIMFDVFKVYEIVFNTINKAAIPDKYYPIINLLMLMDILKKFKDIQTPFKKEFFDKMKPIAQNIDFTTYDNIQLLDFEKMYVNKFKFLKSANFQDFCNFMGLAYE